MRPPLRRSTPPDRVRGGGSAVPRYPGEPPRGPRTRPPPSDGRRLWLRPDVSRPAARSRALAYLWGHHLRVGLSIPKPDERRGWPRSKTVGALVRVPTLVSSARLRLEPMSRTGWRRCCGRRWISEVEGCPPPVVRVARGVAFGVGVRVWCKFGAWRLWSATVGVEFLVACTRACVASN